jgi:hypothetical protein
MEVFQMAFQMFVIILQLTAMSAFLILWYFWIKRRMEASLLLEEEHQVLFPFKYFSWIFIGLVVLTSLVQIHFVRVSSSIHERMAAIVGFYKKHEQNAKTVEEIKATLDLLKADLDNNLKSLRMSKAENALSKMSDTGPEKEFGNQDKPPLVALGPTKSTSSAFAKEARASALRTQEPDRPKADDETKVYSMRLSRSGRAAVDNLRVRKRPEAESEVVDKLNHGQEVKVTEKRLQNDTVWFRIITPTGKAGWVDYKYLKLEGNV